MTLGHYLWTNTDPDKPGFGEVIDIDVDTLPVTDKPSNVLQPNLRIGTGDDGLEAGRYYHLWPVPNFYIDPDDNRLYHSTTPPTQEFLNGMTIA